MPLEILRQVSWTGGELHPRLVGRRDLKTYYQSSAALENLLPTPQGPLLRRPGLAFVDLVRNPVTSVEIPGGAHTAPHGGDISSVINPEETTALVSVDDLGTLDPYSVIELDFGAPVTVHLVDVADYAAVAAGTGGDDAVPPAGDDYPFGRPFGRGTALP